MLLMKLKKLALDLTREVLVDQPEGCLDLLELLEVVQDQLPSRFGFLELLAALLIELVLQRSHPRLLHPQLRFDAQAQLVLDVLPLGGPPLRLMAEVAGYRFETEAHLRFRRDGGLGILGVPPGLVEDALYHWVDAGSEDEVRKLLAAASPALPRQVHHAAFLAHNGPQAAILGAIAAGPGGLGGGGLDLFEGLGQGELARLHEVEDVHEP
eukprot:761600-Hanusia_phi.AAC.8